jgi:hypothetical protein
MRYALTTVALLMVFMAGSVIAADTPRSGMMCGKCAEGYAVVGVGKDLKMCPDDDGMVVQCASVGIPRLAVCGSCPDGYVQVGSSSVPARCGDADGGRMSQCQLSDLGAGLPDSKPPTLCPPDCGTAATPGHGGGPVPQVRDLRQKDKPE